MARVSYLRADKRREAIIQAVTPLLISRGGDITSMDMSEAAGTSIGAIFRVFQDKDAVIRACLLEIATSNNVEARVAACAAIPDLRDRLVEAGAILHEHIKRVVPVADTLRRSAASDSDPALLLKRLVQSIETLLKDAHPPSSARVGLSQAAEVFAGMIYANVAHQHVFQAPGQPVPVLVDVFLYGFRGKAASLSGRAKAKPIL